MVTSILLIEPITSERLAFGKAISHTAYSICYEGSDEENLVQLFDEYHPDVVVMSAVSTGRAGMSLLSELKRAHPEAKVLLTVYSTEGDHLEDAVEESGIVGTLRKPFNRKKVLEKLTQARASDAGARRRAARIETRLLCHYKASGEGFFAARHMAVCDDISPGGILFHTSFAHTEGDILDLEIELPDGNRPVKARGVVRRVEELMPNRAYRFGIEFQQIASKDLDKVNAYLAKAGSTKQKTFDLVKAVTVVARESHGQFVRKASARRIGLNALFLISEVPYPSGADLLLTVDAGPDRPLMSLRGTVRACRDVTPGKQYEVEVSGVEMEKPIAEQFQGLIGGASSGDAAAP
ncbi:MAG: PilZ domain-containing protein [Planctomycetes bacterium]|nr:PilZ domain-containing protein [Planctomycetota bacterium]